MKTPAEWTHFRDFTSADTKEHRQALIAEVQQDVNSGTLGYAQRLATTIWENHWKQDAPNWKPLDDVLGVLTQIDNMAAGMSRTNTPFEVQQDALQNPPTSCPDSSLLAFGAAHLQNPVINPDAPINLRDFAEPPKLPR